MKQWLKRHFGIWSLPAGDTSQEEWRRSIWSIGIYLGQTPLELKPSDRVDNPVLTRADVSDVRASFVADPFMIEQDGIWYMFFEVMNERTGRGEIGLATSENGLVWRYQQIVLREPFHLSYPYVFGWMNDHFMIPENDRAIRLYKAIRFPDRWSFVGDMLAGRRFIDASLFRYDDRWWVFAETNPRVQFDTLRLYFADDLFGPWVEHPQSPIVEGDQSLASPAGRMLVENGRVFRVAQNCERHYGSQVRAFEILELSPTTYHEREMSISPILQGSGSGWNECGMHHVDSHRTRDGGWIACVDGWRLAK